MLAREIATSSGGVARSVAADRATAAVAVDRSGRSPASWRAALATGDAIAAVIHHRTVTALVISPEQTLLVILPVLTLQTPSRSMMLIGTAPLRARYSAARFRFGAFASMGNVDSGSRRQTARENSVEGPNSASTKALWIP